MLGVQEKREKECERRMGRMLCKTREERKGVWGVDCRECHAERENREKGYFSVNCRTQVLLQSSEGAKDENGVGGYFGVNCRAQVLLQRSEGAKDENGVGG